jgi:hypothetical protein
METNSDSILSVEHILASYLNCIQAMINEGINELNKQAENATQSEQDTKNYCIDLVQKTTKKAGQFLVVLEKYCTSEGADGIRSMKGNLTTLLKLISSVMWLYSMGIDKSNSECAYERKEEAEQYANIFYQHKYLPADPNFEAIIDCVLKIMKLDSNCMNEYVNNDSYFQNFVMRSNKVKIIQSPKNQEMADVK